VSNIVEHFTEFTLRKAKDYIHFPETVEEKAESILKFSNLSRSKIPSILKVVDGTHIPIKPPVKDEFEYVTRKQFHSRNYQIVSL